MRTHFNDVMKQHKSLEDILGYQQVTGWKSESFKTLTDYSDYLNLIFMGPYFTNHGAKDVAT